MANKQDKGRQKLDIKVIEAIKDGDLVKVKEWLNTSGGDINNYTDTRIGDIVFHNGRIAIRIDHRGMTALHYAALYTKIEIVKLLLENGADPSINNGKWQNKMNALIIALQSECEDSAISEVVAVICDWLCKKQKKDCLLDTEVLENSPLLIAIRQNLSISLQTLLDYGGEDFKLLKDRRKAKCLQIAVMYKDNGKALDVLLKNEMWRDPRVINYCPDYRTTALHLAVMNHDIKKVEALVNHGADSTRMDSYGTCPIHCLIERTADEEKFQRMVLVLHESINKQDDKFGHTPLHKAVIKNNCKFVEILRNKFKADFTISDKEGKFPLHYLSNHTKNEYLVKLLADETVICALDNDGHTPLYYAVIKNDHKLVGTLLETATSLDSKDYRSLFVNGFPVIYWATQSKGTDEEFYAMLSTIKSYAKTLFKQANIFQRLIDFKADQTDNKTPLQLALDSKMFSAMEILLDFGANPSGQKLLHLASVSDCSESDYVRLVKKLYEINQGIINEVDGEDNKKTPLHYAMDARKFTKVKVLLKYGADPSLPDKIKRNSLHYAFQRNAPQDVMKYLIRYQPLYLWPLLRCGLDVLERTPLQYLNASTNLSAVKALNTVEHKESEIFMLQEEQTYVDIHMEHDYDHKILRVPRRLTAMKLLDQANSHFGQVCNCIEVIDNSEDLVQEDDTVKEDDTYLLQEGAKLKLTTKEEKQTSLKIHLEHDDDCKVLKVPRRLAATNLLFRQANSDCEVIDNSVDLMKDDVYFFKEGTKFKLSNKKNSPLELAIAVKRYDVVKVLLVKGAKLEVETLKDAIIRDHKELAHILVRHAKNIKEVLTSCVEIQSRHSATKQTTLFKLLIHKMPNVAEEALDRCVKLDKDKNGKSLLKFDHSYIHVDHYRCRKIHEICFKQKRHKSATHPIDVMVKEKRVELLQHPVVWMYLYQKWNYLGLWYYMLGSFIYLLFLASLCFFALIVNDPQSTFCNPDVMRNGSVRSGACGPYSQLVATYVLAVSVIILALIHLLIEFFQVINSPKEYLKDSRNYIQLPLFCFSIVFVFVFPNKCGCPADWQWQIGIFVVFLGWTNLLFIISKYPVTGVYVLVFKEILITFFKLASFSVYLVLGFSVILFMMFGTPVASISSFTDIGVSVVKTVTMVTGELGFEDLFNLAVPPSEYIPIPYYVTNFIMWIVFLIIVPIILNNMLTSLAVGDTKGVIENAQLQTLILQAETVFEADRVVLDSIKKWLDSKFKFQFADSIFELDYSLWDTVKLSIFGGREYLEGLEETVKCYEEERTLERQEIVGEKFTEGDNDVTRNQEQILQRLDKLFDLVRANDDQIRKCQKQLQSISLKVAEGLPSRYN